MLPFARQPPRDQLFTPSHRRRIRNGASFSRAPVDESDIEEINRNVFITYSFIINIFTEKKDLVELVIRQNGPDDGGDPGVGVGPSSSGSGSSGSGEQPPRPRRMPEERQKSFPKAYTESTHRHEWLAKMENAQDAPSDGIQLRVEEDDQDDFIVVTTTVQPMEQDDPEETGGKAKIISHSNAFVGTI